MDAHLPPVLPFGNMRPVVNDANEAVLACQLALGDEQGSRSMPRTSCGPIFPTTVALLDRMGVRAGSDPPQADIAADGATSDDHSCRRGRRRLMTSCSGEAWPLSTVPAWRGGDRPSERDWRGPRAQAGRSAGGTETSGGGTTPRTSRAGCRPWSLPLRGRALGVPRVCRLRRGPRLRRRAHAPGRPGHHHLREPGRQRPDRLSTCTPTPSSMPPTWRSSTGPSTTTWASPPILPPSPPSSGSGGPARFASGCRRPEALALADPSWQVVLIGPVQGQVDETRLRRHPPTSICWARSRAPSCLAT